MCKLYRSVLKLPPFLPPFLFSKEENKKIKIGVPEPELELLEPEPDFLPPAPLTFHLTFHFFITKIVRKV